MVVEKIHFTIYSSNFIRFESLTLKPILIAKQPLRFAYFKTIYKSITYVQGSLTNIMSELLASKACFASFSYLVWPCMQCIRCLKRNLSSTVSHCPFYNRRFCVQKSEATHKVKLVSNTKLKLRTWSMLSSSRKLGIVIPAVYPKWPFIFLNEHSFY